MKAACQAGKFNGPPSCTPFQPPPPKNLAEAENAPPADVPADDDSTYGSAPPEAAPAKSARENSSTVQRDDGSIDTCGSRGGLTCKTGLCCSSHGYVSEEHFEITGNSC